MSVTLYEGDCRDYIPEVKADLIIMDPPYDVKSNRGGGADSVMKKIHSTPALNGCRRVCPKRS